MNTINLATFLANQIKEHGEDISPEMNTLENLLSLVNRMYTKGDTHNLSVMEGILQDVMISNIDDHWAAIHYEIVRNTRKQTWSLSGNDASFVIEAALLTFTKYNRKLKTL